MSDLRLAATQALEAIDCLEAPPTGAINHYELERRKNALRAALAQPDVPGGVSADSQNPRDKDDVPLERAVLVREWKAMRLAISTPRSQPDGYVLVPVEPTQAMLDANGTSCVPEDMAWLNENARQTWAAMLAAAPKGGA